MKSDITRLVNMGCYRGLRHTQGLPVRGQRTSTNGKTAKKMAKARASFLGDLCSRMQKELDKGRKN
eukprot:1213830-Amorphochlora_amoeboformis.AAC.1